MMIFSTIAILLFTVLSYGFIILMRKRRSLKNVPGPKANIIFGNTIDFLFKPTYEYFDVLLKYFDKYGPITRLYDGPLSLAVIVKDVKLVEHILSSPKLIDKSGQYEYLHSWLGMGLLTSTGAKWKSHRRMLTPSFHFSILDNFVDVFETVGDVFIRKLEKEVGKNSVDICPFVSLCTLDIISEAAMGIKLNAQSDKASPYVRSVKTVCGILTDRMYSALHPILYPLTPNYFREKRALRILHGHTDSIIEKRINERNKRTDQDVTHTFDTKKKLAFLDLLLNSTIDGKSLSRIDIREEVDTFMFEGHDTTSSAISFAMYSLATNPEVQEKVYHEQRLIFEDLKNAKVSIAQLQEMKYLELVIKETLRLYPSVPYIGRSMTEDVEWDGMVLPKRQNIMLFTFGIQRDPKYFPEPLKFIPERFEDSSGRNPYVYTPFSAGPRNCIGQKFAMLEMKSTISKVIRNFELCPSTPVHTLQLAPETILVSKNGVCISIKNRSL